MYLNKKHPLTKIVIIKEKIKERIWLIFNDKYFYEKEFKKIMGEENADHQ